MRKWNSPTAASVKHSRFTCFYFDIFYSVFKLKRNYQFFFKIHFVLVSCFFLFDVSLPLHLKHTWAQTTNGGTWTRSSTDGNLTFLLFTPDWPNTHRDTEREVQMNVITHQRVQTGGFRLLPLLSGQIAVDSGTNCLSLYERFSEMLWIYVEINSLF